MIFSYKTLLSMLLLISVIAISLFAANIQFISEMNAESFTNNEINSIKAILNDPNLTNNDKVQKILGFNTDDKALADMIRDSNKTSLTMVNNYISSIPENPKAIHS